MAGYFGAGCSIVLAGGPLSGHLWFILSDPSPEQMLAVMLVSLKPHSDKTLILTVGDHPFIQHDSALDYSNVSLFTISKLNAALASSRCIPHPNMSNGLLKRVRAAVLASQRTPDAMLKICRERFG